MPTLHVAPTDTAGGALLAALAQAGRNDAVLAFRDDLSCGPIEPDDWTIRAAWWAPFYDASETGEAIRSFWERLTQGDEQIVLWFGGRSAAELSFFHACAARLGNRQFSAVDVTGVTPHGRVSAIQPEMLASRLDRAQPVDDGARRSAAQHWRHLQAENAAFRIVTPSGLASAPIDHFDSRLLEQIGPDPVRAAAVIVATMHSGAYLQVGDLMLQTRLLALSEQGKIAFDGDPTDLLAASVRRLTTHPPSS